MEQQPNSQRRVVASRFTVLVPLRHGRALAYNGSSGALAVLEANERSALEALSRAEDHELPRSVWRSLAHGGFVVAAERNELAELEELYRAHRYDPQLLTLTIAPTIACNFGCDYCFQGADKPGDTMSERVQDAIVGLVERSAPNLRRMHVAWYGGEPLLRVGIIESLSNRIIERCAAHGVGYDASIVTNGYRLTPQVAEMLHSKRVRTAQVTLDGDQHSHDERRHLLSGGPTFERILDNLVAVVNASPLAIQIRVNVDGRNAGEVRELVDALVARGLAGRKNFRLYFAPVEAITTGCHAIGDACLDKREYGELEAELYRHAFDQGLAALPYPPRFHGVCAAVRPGGFVITPTGHVHKCWDTVTQPEHAVGTILDIDGLLRSDTAKAWLRWSPFRNQACRNCKLLPVCSGACAFKFLHADQTRGEAATLPCPSWKFNLNERLLLRAEKSGAITRDDIDPVLARSDPAALCADVHVAGGEALPLPMQAVLASNAS